MPPPYNNQIKLNLQSRYSSIKLAQSNIQKNIYIYSELNSIHEIKHTRVTCRISSKDNTSYNAIKAISRQFTQHTICHQEGALLRQIIQLEEIEYLNLEVLYAIYRMRELDQKRKRKFAENTDYEKNILFIEQWHIMSIESPAHTHRSFGTMSTE